MSVKGALVLQVGTAEKTVEKKNVTIKGDAKIKVGPVEVSKSRNLFGDGNAVGVMHTEPNLKSVVFLDKEGKVLANQSTSGGTLSDGVNTTYMKDYNLKGKAEGMTVRVTYYSKIENVTVPFNLVLGLGL